MSEIKEVPYDDKNICVSAVEMSCDDNVDMRVPQPLPQNSSCMLLRCFCATCQIVDIHCD